MPPAASFQRVILRAVLREVSPMVIRVLAVPDDTELADLHEMFQALMGWDQDLGYSFRIHGQEFNNFRRKPRSQPLRAFQFHRQEKFRYIADTLHLWEWEIRVLDVDAGTPEDRQPRCLSGRGAAPPEGCGGPTGYRLMRKRQQAGAWVSDPALVELTVQRLAVACPEQPARTWELLRTTVRDGWQSIDQRLQAAGPLHPDRFSLREANEHLATYFGRGRWER